MLTEEQVNKFQILYKNRFGKEISKKEALEKGTKLVRLMQIVYQPMTESEYKQLRKRRRHINNYNYQNAKRKPRF